MIRIYKDCDIVVDQCHQMICRSSVTSL